MKHRKKSARKNSFMKRLMGHGEGYEDVDTMDEEMDEGYDYDDYNNDADEEGTDIHEFNDMPNEELQINLIDKGNMLVAHAIVAGVSGNDIDVNISREMLTIKTQSNEHHLEKEGNYLYEEVAFGSFFRSIMLPTEVEVDASEADIHNGVLKITMPKIDKTLHKKINVRKK